MTGASVVKTGVELSLDDDAAATGVDATHRRELTVRAQAGEVVLVRSRPFVDLLIETAPERWHGNDRHSYLELDRDPTNQLMELVDGERADFSNLYTDVVYAWEAGVARWEFYGAPFHIELSPELEARLADSWEPKRSA